MFYTFFQLDIYIITQIKSIINQNCYVNLNNSRQNNKYLDRALKDMVYVKKHFLDLVKKQQAKANVINYMDIKTF